MENLRGWKTITFMVVTALLAGVESLTDIISIPDWYFSFIVPFVGVVLRYLTSTPIGKSE